MVLVRHSSLLLLILISPAYPGMGGRFVGLDIFSVGAHDNALQFHWRYVLQLEGVVVRFRSSLLDPETFQKSHRITGPI